MNDLCPICLIALESDDLCSTDIELGICHAECLAGSPVVDLETGMPAPDGEIDTYLYSEVCDDCKSAGPHRERTIQ